MCGVDDWSGVVDPEFEVLLLVELFVSVVPFASLFLWCFLCFFVVVVSPFASVEVCVLVELLVVSVEPALPDCAAASLLCDWVSACGIELLSVFIESLPAASFLVVSLLVLCAASLLVVVELCASAGFAGVCACAIRCGVVAELLSDWGVVLVFGVALSGVLLGVVVVVDEEEFVVVLLVPLSVVLAAPPFL